MKPHHNTGKRNAAKPPTEPIYFRVDAELKREFEKKAGGKGRILNKWILETLKNAIINTVHANPIKS